MTPPKGWGYPTGNSFYKNRSYCYWKKPCVLCPLCLSVQWWPGGLCKPDPFSCLGPSVSCLCKSCVSFTLCFTCVSSVFPFIYNESVFHLHYEMVSTVVTSSLVCSFVHWTSITDQTHSTVTLWAGVLTHTGCHWLAQFQQLRAVCDLLTFWSAVCWSEAVTDWLIWRTQVILWMFSGQGNKVN